MNGQESISIAELKVMVKNIDLNMIRIDKENKDAHNKILNRMDKNLEKIETKIIKADDDCEDHREKINIELNKKIGWSTYKWINGGIAGLILVGFIYIGGISLQNKITLTKLSDFMHDHIAFSTIVYKEITGEDWGHASREALDRARKKVDEVRAKALAEEKE